ncbi:MAG: M4 family metallopeptidase, partial [Pseudomonadota bacterium]
IAYDPDDEESVEKVRNAIEDIISLEDTTKLDKEGEEKLPMNIGKATRYNQLFNEIPIWNSQVIVEEDGGGTIKSISGNATYGIVAAQEVHLVKPRLSSDQALQLTKDQYQEQSNSLTSEHEFKYENESAELFYIVDEETGDLVLTYKVSFFTHVAQKENKIVPIRPVVFINADNAEILKSYENIQRASEAGGVGGNKKTGRYVYGENGNPGFLVTKKDGSCRMENENVITENLGHQYYGIGKAYEFPCDTNSYKQINDAYSPLNDAHAFGKIVFDMFDTWYGSSPLQDKLHLRVHYGYGYENATWNGKQMSFGDGENKFYPLVSLDITAHEVAHGFTEQNSGLIYENQSGGINEAFSDMAGEAAEYFFRQQNSGLFKRSMPDYQTGADIFKDKGGALRYLCDPAADGKSIDHVEDYYDGMDVHYSSGIYNKVFCILSNKAGWNAKKAFDIFYVANRAYWIPNEKFDSGAQKVLRAARRIGYESADVIDAFSNVGIDLR